MSRQAQDTHNDRNRTMPISKDDLNKIADAATDGQGKVNAKARGAFIAAIIVAPILAGLVMAGMIFYLQAFGLEGVTEFPKKLVLFVISVMVFVSLLALTARVISMMARFGIAVVRMDIEKAVAQGVGMAVCGLTVGLAWQVIEIMPDPLLNREVVIPSAFAAIVAVLLSIQASRIAVDLIHPAGNRVEGRGDR